MIPQMCGTPTSALGFLTSSTLNQINVVDVTRLAGEVSTVKETLEFGIFRERGSRGSTTEPELKAPLSRSAVIIDLQQSSHDPVTGSIRCDGFLASAAAITPIVSLDRCMAR